jgi:hypothetical protein
LRRHVVILLGVSLAVALAACEDKKQPQASTVTVGAIPGLPQTAEPAPSETSTGTKLPPPIEQARDAAVPLASIYIPGGRGPARPGAAPDPDQAVIDGARVQAGHCFDGMPTDAPTRSATITVTVVATRVTRTEVFTPGLSDERVTACLKSVGSGLTFPPKNSAGNRGGDTVGDVRTVTIDVNVAARR